MHNRLFKHSNDLNSSICRQGAGGALFFYGIVITEAEQMANISNHAWWIQLRRSLVTYVIFNQLSAAIV